MAKRLTSIRLSKRTDNQITELAEQTGHDFTELVTIAMERMYYDEIRSKVMVGPIYQDFFILCDADDEGALPIHLPDFSGETDGMDAHLRLANLTDLVDYYREHGRYPSVYIEVNHALEYPYGKYDAEYIGKDLYAKLIDQEPAERLYAQAAIVATPSMALI